MWLLRTYTAPALKAAQGHVRSRAAWTAAKYAQSIAKDHEFSQQMVNEVMRCVHALVLALLAVLGQKYKY
jgi:hypothetical protein